MEHILNVFVNEGKLHHRMVPKLFEVWSLIAGVNVVRQNVGTVRLISYSELEKMFDLVLM